MCTGQGDLPERESARQFLRGFRTEATRESYRKKLAQFVRLAGTTPTRCSRRRMPSPSLSRT